MGTDSHRGAGRTWRAASSPSPARNPRRPDRNPRRRSASPRATRHPAVGSPSPPSTTSRRWTAELTRLYPGNLCVAGAEPGVRPSAEVARNATEMTNLLMPLMLDPRNGIYASGDDPSSRFHLDFVVLDQPLYEAFARIGLDKLIVNPWIRRVDSRPPLGSRPVQLRSSRCRPHDPNVEFAQQAARSSHPSASPPPSAMLGLVRRGVRRAGGRPVVVSGRRSRRLDGAILLPWPPREP